MDALKSTVTRVSVDFLMYIHGDRGEVTNSRHVCVIRKVTYFDSACSGGTAKQKCITSRFIYLF